MRFLLIGSLIVILFISGCTQSGSVIKKEVKNSSLLEKQQSQVSDITKVQEMKNVTDSPSIVKKGIDTMPKKEIEKDVANPCAAVACTNSTKTCPDGFQVSCQNVCSNGTCSSCIPNCIGHEVKPDPCRGIVCANTAISCPDGSQVTCENVCEQGICSSCQPKCPEEGEFVISEIMYNPSSGQGADNYNEYIELFNPSPSPIDLAEWLLCGDGLEPGYINHADGTVYENEGTVLLPNSSALITDGGSGTDVYSSFSFVQSLALHTKTSSLCNGLSNTNKTIRFQKGEKIIQASYSHSLGADGNGKSLIFDSEWKESESTPGSR